MGDTPFWYLYEVSPDAKPGEKQMRLVRELSPVAITPLGTRRTA